MEFYDIKDLAYWQRQADEGRAVIIEIPVEMLLDMDIDALSKQNVRPEPDKRARRAASKRQLQTEESVEMQQLQMQMGMSGEDGNGDIFVDDAGAGAGNGVGSGAGSAASPGAGSAVKFGAGSGRAKGDERQQRDDAPVKTRPGIDMDELNAWIEEHQDDLKTLEKKYEAEVRKLKEMERKLYGRAWSDKEGEEATTNEPEGGSRPANGKASGTDSSGSGPAGEASESQKSDEEKVSEVLASANFSNEQMDVIAQAMADGVAAKYLLGIMKEAYSPDTMRKVLAYCMKKSQSDN